MITNKSIFKNEADKKAYYTLYDHSLNTWPVTYESIFVSTSFGDTHVLVSGPVDGRPIVLMHGKGGSATSWRDNIAALSREHRVFALDILGDFGKSTIIKRFSNRSEFVDWLIQVLDGLKIQKTDMVGVSMGSYLIVNFAIEKSERLNKIVLLAPAATFSDFTVKFMLMGALVSLLGIGFLIKRFVRSFVDSNERLENEIFKQSIFGMRCEALGKDKPFLLAERLPDEDLKNIKVPTLLAVGENENINRDNPKVVVERAKNLVLNIQTTILPGGYHSLNMTNPEQVNDLILKFLSD